MEMFGREHLSPSMLGYSLGRRLFGKIKTDPHGEPSGATLGGEEPVLTLTQQPVFKTKIRSDLPKDRSALAEELRLATVESLGSSDENTGRYFAGIYDGVAREVLLMQNTDQSLTMAYAIVNGHIRKFISRLEIEDRKTIPLFAPFWLAALAEDKAEVLGCGRWLQARALGLPIYQ